MTKSKVDQTRARYLAYLDPAGATPEANAAKLDVLADMFIVLNAESVVSPLENSTLETAAVVSPQAVAPGSGFAPRDAWFLRQYEELGSDTYHKPVVIFHQWVRMTQEERATICPTAPNKVGREAVAKAIQRTLQKRKLQESTDPKRKPSKKA